jgi:hypothetical protein
MVMSPAGLRPENDLAGEDQQQLHTTDPSFRQRGRPISIKPQLSDSNKNLVLGRKWMLDTKIDWPTSRLTVSSNIVLTLTSLGSQSRISSCSWRLTF